jgi:hypothetical protein
MPTILECVGFQYDKKEFDGKSLLPAIREDKNLGLISLHVGQSHRVCPDGSLAVVLEDKGDLYHFIRGQFSGQNQKLYNITEDPGERNNLVHDANFSEIKSRSKDLLEKLKIMMQKRMKKLGLKKLEIMDQKKKEALEALGYIAGGAPAPIMLKSAFLMQETIPKVGKLEYFCNIRQPEWGIKRKDMYYPIKILPLDTEHSYIIANRNRELFEYHLQNGFRSMEIQDVHDLAYNSNLGKIFLLKKDGIYSLDAGKRTVCKYEEREIRSLWPVQSIYIDCAGNFYLFKEEAVIKLDKRKNVRKIYNFKQKTSSSFAVDDDGNVYLAEKNTILKYDKDGKRINSFPLESDLKEISSICIDSDKRLWALSKYVPNINIFNLEGEKISSFLYNNYEFVKRGRRWPPVPTSQIYFRDKLFLIDDWEVILVYSFH